MPRVVQWRQNVKTDEEQRERPERGGNANPSDALRTGILELDGKNSEFMLEANPFEHSQVTRAGGIVPRDPVVEECDLHFRPVK